MKIEERWKPLDWVWVTGLGVLATVIRSVRLGFPKELVFDEFYYVPDACRYVTQISGICGPREFTWMQPPMGKWLIGLGLEILGPNRFGWRLFPLVAGVLTVILVYVIGRVLFERRVAAVVAAGLLTFDFMHFLHSRLAMLDIFVTLFVAAGALFALLDREDAGRGVLRPWRWGAGACLGAAIATKWSAAPVLLAVMLLTTLWDRKSGEKPGAPARGLLVASSVVAFALIPLLVYLFSYAGRFDGPLLAAPWAEGSWYAQWFERQYEAVLYHTQERANLQVLAHPSASPAWSWLLLKRPMAYYLDARGGMFREVLAMGHVLLWPLGIAVLGWLTWLALKLRSLTSTEATILILFASTYLPWFVLTLGGQDPYSYYLLPGLPFFYLAYGAVAERLWSAWPGRVAVGAVSLAAVALWVFYLPLFTAGPLSIPAWRERILFHDCVEFENPALDRLRAYVGEDLPLTGLDRPPRPSDRLFPTGTKATGWCWI